jgi:hemoglobin
MSSPAPNPTPFELLGGDAGVRRLVDRFYDLVDTAPEAATIRKLHAASLKASRDKLHLYLMMWTGGPQTYVERNGHPAFRMRHSRFTSARAERDEWLCGAWSHALARGTTCLTSFASTCGCAVPSRAGGSTCSTNPTDRTADGRRTQGTRR